MTEQQYFDQFSGEPDDDTFARDMELFNSNPEALIKRLRHDMLAAPHAPDTDAMEEPLRSQSQADMYPVLYNGVWYMRRDEYQKARRENGEING